MRIFQKNNSRIKKAAKVVSCGVVHISHSKILDGLAFGLGYLDWFDFSKSAFDEQPSALDQEVSGPAFRERQVELICRISSKLEVRDELIQYLLSGTRLTGERKWTLDDHLAIRWMSWQRLDRLSVIGSTIGSLVTISGVGLEQQAGYLVSLGRGAEVLYDHGEFNCATFEIIAPPLGARPFVPYAHYVPYGIKHYDGFDVLFSREYTPMWRMCIDGRVKRMMPWDDFPDSVQNSSYFKDQTGKSAFHPDTCSVALAYLEKRGVKGLPVLADATPALIKKGNASNNAIPDALRAYHELGQGFAPTKDKFDKRIDEESESDSDHHFVSLNDWARLLAETGCKEIVHPDFGARGEIEYRGVRLVREREQQW